MALLAACRTISPDSLYRTAQNRLREGRLEQALQAADAGLRAEPSWRFRLMRAEVLTAIDPKKANQVLASLPEPDSPEMRARFEKDRGWAAFLVSDFARAEAALSDAHKLASSAGLGPLESEIEIDRGALLAQYGHRAEAEESFRLALKTAADYGDLYLQTRATGSLGVLYLRSHRPDAALYWLERQRDTAARLGWMRSHANALGNLGSCYYRLGDYDLALRYLREAERMFRQIGDRREQQIWLGNIGNVELERDNFSAALESFKPALTIAREIGEKSWIASWLNNLAIVSLNLKDFDTAENYNAEALQLKRELRQSEIYPLVNEAHIARGRKNFAQAEKLYRDVLSSGSDDPAPVLEAEIGLSQLFIDTGQFNRAEAEFRSAIAFADRRRAALIRDEFKLSYFNTLMQFYRRYVDFLVTRGEAARALEVAESSRARLLEEKLNEDSRLQSPITAAALEQLARRSHSVLLYYWLAPDRSFFWEVTGGRIQLHILPPEQQIASLIDAYRSFLESLRDPLESEFPAGRKLAETLLGAVESENARLIVVPDRALHSLNLETLPDPRNPSRYLIERAEVDIAPSLGVLMKARKPAPPSRSILIVGDPEPAVEEYPRLAFASKEIEMIGRSFAPERRAVLEGARAYPAAYRESEPARYSWIHFAAHAAANRESPLDSALILSRQNGAYALAARDIMNIALNADLVTLSACRSAGARIYSGEGLVGLTWAFLRAGARNVVAGLWDVTDMSTAALMADFYAQLAKGAAPADALRQAQLNLLHSRGAYRKPFYWGPFQLYAGVAPG